MTHEYDGEGRLGTTTIDTLGDGRIDSVTDFGYDEAGQLLYSRRDDMDDGTIEASTEYTLDVSGRPRIVDEFASDELTSRTSYDYDDEGRVILETSSYPNRADDFVIERRYDRAGNLLAEAEYHERRREYDQCRRYEYECF